MLLRSSPSSVETIRLAPRADNRSCTLSAVSAAEVRRAAELGAALVAALSPKEGRKKAPVDPARAAWVALRDRLWTLLVQDYRAVQRVGAWLWLGEAGEHVPGLQARVLGPRRKGTAGT